MEVGQVAGDAHSPSAEEQCPCVALVGGPSLEELLEIGHLEVEFAYGPVRYHLARRCRNRASQLQSLHHAWSVPFVSAVWEATSYSHRRYRPNSPGDSVILASKASQTAGASFLCSPVGSLEAEIVPHCH